MVNLKSILAGALLGMGSLTGGYVGADYCNRARAMQIEEARERGLEQILACTYKVKNTSKYDFGLVDPDDESKGRDIREHGVTGSATAVYRDLEGFVYFLTSNHVAYNTETTKMERIIFNPMPILKSITCYSSI